MKTKQKTRYEKEDNTRHSTLQSHTRSKPRQNETSKKPSRHTTTMRPYDRHPTTVMPDNMRLKVADNYS